jgi:hypothetical protein
LSGLSRNFEIIVRDVEFPTAFANGVKSCPVEICEGLSRRVFGVSREEMRDIDSIDFHFGHISAANFRQGGQKIERSDEFTASRIRFDVTWPLDDAGFANAALEAGQLSTSKGTGTSGMVPVGEEGTIVAEEDEDGVLLQALGFQGVQ